MKKYVNGTTLRSVALASPAAERSEIERRGEGRAMLDPEVVIKARRRQFTGEYKKRILAEADAAREPGAIGALLRREGLYSSHLTHWRQQREAGLIPQRRGPKIKHDPLLEEVRKLKQQNGRLEQRLERAELIIEVQKKVSLLLGIPLATVDGDGSKS
jgi:transposase